MQRRLFMRIRKTVLLSRVCVETVGQCWREFRKSFSGSIVQQGQ